MPTFYPGQKDYIQQLNRLDGIATAQKGEKGEQGVKGETGNAGPANTLAIGTVTQGASALATITGTSPAQILNLTLPQGLQGIQGIQGIQGAQGPANTLAIGTVSTGPSAATITGTAPNQTLNLTLAQGVQGNQGVPGPANTLAIGTVTTGTAAATVTGTAPNQTLNLTLPTAPANTLTIGTVSAGAAAATITGTAPNQTLNLTLQTGATGARGLTTRGAWAAGTAYAVDDLATNLGSTYRRKVAGTTATVPGSDATNWEIFAQKGADGAGAVSTVNSVAPVGGNVTLGKADLGLDSVDNTSDASKPVSTAQQTALNLKAPIASPALTGNVAVGTGGSVSTSLMVNKPVSGAAISYGVRSNGVVQSTVTEAMSFASNPGTAAAAFTLDYMHHFFAGQGTLGAGSTVNNQIGYYVGANLIGATNNFGFHGNIASGAGRWNLYMSGTASNYMTGKLLIGSTTDTGELLQIYGSAKFTGTVSGVTKSMVGLGNVDNTSDMDKPVSTAQAAAIAAGSNTYLPGDVLTTVRALTAPTWLLCDGSQYLRSSYPDLSALIGATYSPNKLANPSVLPSNTAYFCAVSSDGTYIVVPASSSPYVYFYKRTGDVVTKLPDSGTSFGSSFTSATFTSDDAYVCVANGGNMFVIKRSGDTFTTLSYGVSFSGTFPQGNISQVVYSPDDIYFGVAHSTTPYLAIYKKAGDMHTRLANPATLPTSNSNCLAFSPNSTYLVFGNATAPFMTVYKRSGDVFTKLADPTTLPAGNVNRVSFSGDGIHFAVQHDNSPFLSVYKIVSDVVTKISNPAQLPTAGGFMLAYSPDGKFLTVGSGASPYFITYSCAGDGLTKMPDPSTPIATASTFGGEYSGNGAYLVLTTTSGPYVHFYSTGNDATMLRVPANSAAYPALDYIKT